MAAAKSDQCYAAVGAGRARSRHRGHFIDGTGVLAPLGLASLLLASLGLLPLAPLGLAPLGLARSDMQLKDNIVRIGTLDSGIGIYRFNYKDEDQTGYVGVLAQEVQKIMPSAVARASDGYLSVDYSRLGFRFMSWDEWQEQNAVTRLSTR